MKRLKSLFTIFLFSILLICSSCIQSTTDVKVKKTKKDNLSIQVSQVKIQNNKIILKGSHLSSITELKIEGFSQSFTILSNDGSELIASPASYIALKLDTLMNLIISSANASTVIPVQFDLDVPGAHANDFLQFNGTHWESKSLNGVNYKGTWSAAGAAPDLAPNPGDYYIVSANGSYALDGITSWTKGDWAIYADSITGWQKLDNSTGTFHLESLGNVQITAPTTNQVLTWNGTKWINQTFVVPAEVDPKVGAVTASKWCRGDGTQVVCDQSTPTTTETDPNVSAFAKATLPNCSATQVLTGNGTNLSCKTDDIGAAAFTGTPNYVVVTNGSGALTVSGITTTVFNYLSGVTSSIQTQLDSKAASASIIDWSAAGATNIIHPSHLNMGLGLGDKALITDTSANIVTSTVTSTELGHLSGVSANVQTQLDNLSTGSWTSSSGNVYRATGNVGIGTNNPTSLFQVNWSPGASWEVQYLISGAGNGHELRSAYDLGGPGEGRYTFTKSRGTLNSPTPVLSGDFIGTVSFRAYNTATTTLNTANIRAIAAENFTATAAGGDLVFSTTNIGATVNSEKMRILANGNVGIKTVTPTTALDINGDVSFNSVVERSTSYSVPSATAVNITLPTGGVTLLDGSIYKFHLATPGTGTITGATYIVYQTAVATWATKLVSSNGNTSNHPLLQVSGTNVQLYHNHAATYNITVFTEVIKTGNTTIISPHYFGLEGAMTNVSGNIGIGTNNPTSKLYVQPTDLATDSGITIKQGLTSTAVYQTLFNVLDKGGSELFAIKARGSDGAVAFDVPGMRTSAVKDSVGLSITTSTNAAQSISVKGIFLGTSYTGVATTAGKIDTGSGINLVLAPAGATAVTILPDGKMGVGVGTPGYKLDVGGDINMTTGSVFRINGTSICTSSGCTASSDLKLKKNVSSLSGAYEKILKLQGVEYDWKDKTKYSDKHQVGLIAQDVEKIYPEVVLTDSKSGLKSIAYDHLISPLIEAFKTLNKMVIELLSNSKEQSRAIATIRFETDAKIEKLEKENSELRTRLERIEKALAPK